MTGAELVRLRPGDAVRKALRRAAGRARALFMRGVPRGLTAATNHGDTCGTDAVYAVWRLRGSVAARARGPAATIAGEGELFPDPLAVRMQDRLLQQLAEDGVVLGEGQPGVGVVLEDEQPAGGVSLAPFVEYALTLDLLERELVDALAGGAAARPGCSAVA